jgi:hypothetical protein
VTIGPSTELALPPTVVEELLQALVKALRAHQLYLPNNPVYQRAIEALRAAFAPVWEAQDDLVLDVFESELKWESHVVYSQPSRGESIAWVLYKDGVRSVTFLPGVEQEEIVGLLDVLHRARTLQPEDNDDLLTLLWEKDLQLVRYVFREMAAPESGTMQIPTSEEVAATVTDQPHFVGETVREEAPQLTGVVKPEDFDSTLYFLDEREIDYLRKEVDREYSQDLRRNVLAMLFDVLELQPYPTVRAELISILESFLPYLLGAGDFVSVAYVLREVRAVLQRARELLPEHRASLEGLPGRLSQPDALSQLLQSLDEAAAHPAADELGELFGELRPESLSTLLAWLPRVSSERVRTVLEDSMRRLAAAHVSTLVEAITGADPVVALEAVKLAGKLRLEDTVPALGQSLVHPETAVRFAAVQALAELGTPSALQGLERSLDDADRDVRLTTIRALMQRHHRGALAKVTAAVEGRSVRSADLSEKMAFFEAYGALVGEAGVAGLDAMLNRRGLLKRRESPETRACAALALGRIGSPAAREALERALGAKEPLVRNAVSRALRGAPEAQS